MHRRPRHSITVAVSHDRTENPNLFSELKHLQTVISGINRDDAIPLVHRDAPRVCKFARLAPGASPDGQRFAGFLVDLLYAIVAEFTDDQISVAILVQPIGKS